MKTDVNGNPDFISQVIAGRGFLVISHLLGRSSRRHLTLELLQVNPSLHVIGCVRPAPIIKTVFPFLRLS